MFERRHIEQLLKVNGVPVTAPDEEIKSVLVSARWHEKDVETAMLVLRENTTSHESRVDTLHKVFQSDQRVNPETLSALLGVEVSIKNEDINTEYKKPRRTVTAGQILQISLISLFSSVIFVLISMWYLEMGIFHITMR